MVRVKIKKIDIHNFLSFQDEEWDFDNTNRLVLIKGINKDTETTLGNTSNGSGKSALSHALMYSLFGQLYGKIHNSNLKNKFSDELMDNWKMMVSVEVDTVVSSTDIKHWKIIRGIQKGSSTVVLQLISLSADGEWKDISKSSSANTQKFIEDNVLCMNFEMYQRLVMLSIEDKYNFFKLNAGQKRDFVETLFDTSIYSKMYKMMVDDMKSKNMVIQNLKVNQMKYAKTKEVCEESIERYKSSVKDQISETNSAKSDIEEKVNGFDPKFQEIEERRKTIEDALSKIRENKMKLDEIIAKCNEVMTNARIEINNHETTISHHQRELNKHKEVLGMICEDCKKVVNKFYSLDVYRDEIEKLNSQIGQEKDKIENCTGQIAKVKVYDDMFLVDATHLADNGYIKLTPNPDSQDFKDVLEDIEYVDAHEWSTGVMIELTNNRGEKLEAKVPLDYYPVNEQKEVLNIKMSDLNENNEIVLEPAIIKQFNLSDWPNQRTGDFIAKDMNDLRDVKITDDGKLIVRVWDYATEPDTENKLTLTFTRTLTGSPIPMLPEGEGLMINFRYELELNITE